MSIFYVDILSLVFLSLKMYVYCFVLQQQQQQPKK